MKQSLSIPERLKIFYARLAQAPQCETADEALVLVSATLEAVEDGFSGVAKNPNPSLERDGRMYHHKQTTLNFCLMAPKLRAHGDIK